MKIDNYELLFEKEIKRHEEALKNLEKEKDEKIYEIISKNILKTNEMDYQQSQSIKNYDEKINNLKEKIKNLKEIKNKKNSKNKIEVINDDFDDPEICFNCNEYLYHDNIIEENKNKIIELKKDNDNLNQKNIVLNNARKYDIFNFLYNNKS